MAGEARQAGPCLARRPPGYRESSCALERLSRFQDLVRHHQRWAHPLKFARPIEELLPLETPQEDRPDLLKREIHRLIPLVCGELKRAKVNSAFCTTRDEMKFDSDKGMPVTRETTHTFDVVRDYFLIPFFDDRRGGRDYFDLLMACLDQGIGFYLEARRAAFRRKFNPLCWLGFVIRLPIMVLEAAGLQNEETQSAVLKVYGWIVRVLILLLLAAWLRVSIPWQEVLPWLFR